MHKLTTLGLGCILVLVGAACGPERPSGLSLHLEFAVLEQAQTGQGLPADLRSLRVEIRPLGLDETAQDDTGCLDLSADAKEREQISLDALPGQDLVVIVSGWASGGCAGDPDWLGISWGLDVVEGQETDLSLYVTRQGLRLNPIRDRLDTPRAFASATLLPDRRVLIAGGFEQVAPVGGAFELVAACDALIYDPGSATIVRRLPLHACRGMHAALSLPNGQVLLVGGCGRAIFDPAGSNRPMLRPEVDSLLSSAELYDPDSGSFIGIPTDSALRRADAAAVVRGDGRVALFGGRTSDQLRSTGVVTGSGSGANWSFQTLAGDLGSARSGARAVALSAGILVAGGNLPADSDLELFSAQFEGTPLVPQGQGLPYLALAGHNLTATGSATFLLTGGASNAPGGAVSDAALSGVFSGSDLTLQAHTLAHPRAYHAAALLQAMGSTRLIVAGGLNDQFESTPDLELVSSDQAGHLLSDPLTTGAIGLAMAPLLDGSLLLVGGLDLDPSGQASLSDQGQILTP